ncbi:MAG: methyltransferase domain-containing protein [Propionicimonas sp.]|jgi:ubiquinone/menaquinone biosynthesis C-methylase UbiE
MDEVKGDAGLAGAFDQAAPRYDLLTGLNPGYHRHLDAAARQLAERLGPDPGLLLDLGCGSGSSTAALLRHAPSAKVVGVDASAGMLAQARSKRWPAGVEFYHLPAQQLADLALPQADGALAAYLLRNLSPGDRDRTLAVILGRLRPGGWLVVQEYSVAGRRWATAVWTVVCWLVVIPLSWLVRGSPRLYRYLWRSVRHFDSTADVLVRLGKVGFTAVERRPVTGWQRGILHTFLAQRPHLPAPGRE